MNELVSFLVGNSTYIWDIEFISRVLCVLISVNVIGMIFHFIADLGQR